LVKAKALGLATIALTGRDGGETGRVVDVHLNVPSGSTPRVQEVHRTMLHVLCELIERGLQ
jgi:D-sedoheptulose 7-phosphate isomerase